METTLQLSSKSQPCYGESLQLSPAGLAWTFICSLCFSLTRAAFPAQRQDTPDHFQQNLQANIIWLFMRACLQCHQPVHAPAEETALFPCSSLPSRRFSSGSFMPPLFKITLVEKREGGRHKNVKDERSRCITCGWRKMKTRKKQENKSSLNYLDVPEASSILKKEMVREGPGASDPQLRREHL